MSVEAYASLAETSRSLAERAQAAMAGIVERLQRTHGAALADLEAGRDKDYLDLRSTRDKHIQLAIMYSNLAIMHRLCDPIEVG